MTVHANGTDSDPKGAVAVYCGSSTGRQKAYVAAAECTSASPRFIVLHSPQFVSPRKNLGTPEPTTGIWWRLQGDHGCRIWLCP